MRDAIAAKLARDNGLAYDPDSEILVTTGATLGIHAALTALLDEGDEVLLPDPIYDAYQSPIRLCGGRIRPVRSTIEGGRFVLHADALEAALTPASRVLLLNTPWNPVGTVLREDELRAIGDLIVRRNLVLISDEIYEAITYDGCRHISPGGALRRRARAHDRGQQPVEDLRDDRVARRLLRGAGASHPEHVPRAAAVEPRTGDLRPGCGNGGAHLDRRNASAACGTSMPARRQLILSSLADVGRVRVLAPEGGFFAMVDARQTGVPSDEIRRRLLHDTGVVVVHGAAYGPAGEGTLRVSFGSGGETLARGLALLRDGLSAL